MNANLRRHWLLQGIVSLGECGLFFVALVGAAPKSLRYWRELCRQIWFVGAMSLVLVMICGLFVGMVLALQLYVTLSIFGATAAIGTAVALSLFRELGPVITALLVAGRAGTAVTAEIGLMRTTDQLDAMSMMAVDPLVYVASPRFLAGIIAMPLLECVFNAMGIFGGHLVAVSWLGVDNGTFWNGITSTVSLQRDILAGLYKAIVFGGVVSLIAVFQGYTAPPTSEGVAYSTTRTVVFSSIVILAFDFLMTAFMT